MDIYRSFPGDDSISNLLKLYAFYNDNVAYV